MGLEHVTEPTTSATLSMVFVIDSNVLYEVCCFGMNDSEAKVKPNLLFKVILVW